MSDVICNGKTSLPSLEVVRKVEKPTPTVFNMNWLLHIHFSRNNFTTCRRIIESQLKEPLNPEYLYFVKGLIERKEGNYFEALRDFQRAIDINPSNVENFKEIGKTLYAMGRLKQALGVFRDAEHMINRPDHEIFHYIGEIIYRSVQPKASEINEAKGYFQKAVLHGKKLESYQKLAEIYRKEKDYPKAIEILENCLQIAPENTDILAEIGVLYLKVNETQNAFNRLLEVTSINERCVKGLIAFGAILQSRNDIDGALSKYTRICSEDHQGAELWNNIGLCFFKKKKFIVAIACLRKSIWLSPLNYNSLYNLSLVYITAQLYASAFHTLAAAINLRPDSAECYMLLGVCLRSLRDYDNALIAFERASMMADALRNPLIYLNFALFCFEMGLTQKAKQNFANFEKMPKDLGLPTEAKFYAAKLKAVLPSVEDDSTGQHRSLAGLGSMENSGGLADFDESDANFREHPQENSFDGDLV